jgi:hypothetical protein
VWVLIFGEDSSSSPVQCRPMSISNIGPQKRRWLLVRSNRSYRSILFFKSLGILGRVRAGEFVRAATGLARRARVGTQICFSKFPVISKKEWTDMTDWTSPQLARVSPVQCCLSTLDDIGPDFCRLLRAAVWQIAKGKGLAGDWCEVSVTNSTGF